VHSALLLVPQLLQALQVKSSICKVEQSLSLGT
jgi:hypothetical protein